MFTTKDEGTKYEVRGYGPDCRPMKKTVTDKYEALQIAQAVFDTQEGWYSLYNKVLVVKIETTVITGYV